MAATSDTPDGPREISLDSLSIQQLSQIVKQKDEELEFLTESLGQLKSVQQKFVESKENLKSIIPENKNKEALIPLTSSMYVPGLLSNVETVIVDIGTGYFAELSVEKAKEYFQRRIEYVTKQIETVQKVTDEKLKQRDILNFAFQNKYRTMAQKSAAGGDSK